MPRQTRRVPPTIGRFNYWTRWIADPDPAGDDDLPDGAPSIDEEGMADSARTFRAMRDGTERPLLIALRHRALRPILGDAMKDDRALALAAYIVRDRRWQENGEAWALLHQLPRSTQDRLLRVDAQKWRRGRGKEWDPFLQQIATDQRVFEEILWRGPTAHKLVAGSWRRQQAGGGEPPRPAWTRYGISKAEAKRIYDHYIGTAQAIRGLGVKPSSEAWRVALRERGYLDEHGRVPSDPLTSFLAGKSRAERKEQGLDLVWHYFTHALRNLVWYRHGHRKPHWEGDACLNTCLEIRNRLARSPDPA